MNGSGQSVRAMLRAQQREETSATEDALRFYGKTFYFASRLLGRVHAERAATLYAFCRYVDDLADKASSPQEALVSLAAIGKALDTGRPEDEFTRGLLRLRASTGMPLAPVHALLHGVSSDLRPVRIADEDELIRYAYRVAGTVGLLMCSVLDVDDPRAAPFAVDLGIAMQLTNIARDVGEDARLGRRYLPASWVGDVEPEEILAPSPALQVILSQQTRRLLLLADRYYASGEAGLGFLHPRARLAILVAARLYRAIGMRIAANDYRSWDRRAMLSSFAKSLLAVRTMMAFAITPRLHRRDAVHDPTLQRALDGLRSPND